MATKDNYTFKNESSVPIAIAKQLRLLYSSWDDRETDHSYINFFAKDALLSFSPSLEAKGRDGIRAFRDQMIHQENGPVVAVQHIVDICWVPSGGLVADGQQRVMVTGNISYTLKNGRKVGGPFGSLAVFEENELGVPESTFYQVYLDTHEFNNAVKEMYEAEKRA